MPHIEDRMGCVNSFDPGLKSASEYILFPQNSLISERYPMMCLSSSLSSRCAMLSNLLYLNLNVGDRIYDDVVRLSPGAQNKMWM